MKKPKGKLLIVDDNPEVHTTLRLFLQYEFEEVIGIRNPNLLLGKIRNKDIDVILLDMNFSAGVSTGNEGFFWLREILKVDPSAVVLFFTAYGDVEQAVRAVKEGAFDFILKPWDNDKLVTTLQAAYRHRQSKLELEQFKDKQKQVYHEINRPFQDIIGSSNAMKDVFTTIKKISSTSADVLILGENGTGKELIAREVHNQSERSDSIFMAVDLNTLNESLFESELFGYEKGAFTDARESRVGRFEVASGGTLFLDEIGNLPLHLQSKILTAIERREITRLGESKPRPVDVRLICATNKNLDHMVRDQLFRKDLLFRINTIQIDVPALRERGEDIMVLANHYLKYYAAKYNKVGMKLNQSAIDKLMDYPWPGNVRELKHQMEKTVILSDNMTIQSDDLHVTQVQEFGLDLYRSMTLEEVEKQVIMKTIEKHKGNMSRTAKELGIIRQTLYNKIKKYGI